MNLDLSDKVVLVTGGASGIGAAIVRALVDERASPVIVDRDEAAAQALVRELATSSDARVFAVTAELTDASQCARAVEQAVAAAGRLDAVVNNAGVNDRVGLASGSADAFTQSLAKNLVHVYAVTHHALPALTRTRGAIVNIASKVAMTGEARSVTSARTIAAPIPFAPPVTSTTLSASARSMCSDQLSP